MREIKFRAWLPGISKMTYSHTLEELMNWDTKKEDNGTAIWLQYTGLHDKNGKEVYEGDLLQDGKGVGEVKWVQEHCAFLVRTLNPHMYHYLESDERLTESEVIGNIHSNPELLEVTP